MLAPRRGWDQWGAFTVGNALLGSSLLLYTTLAGLWPAVWGHVTAPGLGLGLLGGAVPLAVILALMFLPGQLGRDIVASGIGDISSRHFVFRLVVQVALATVAVEELAFRGVVQAMALRTGLAPWALGASAVSYGLWHAVLQYNGFASQRGAARWLAAAAGTVVYVLLGLLLALVRQAAGGLPAALLAHGVLDVGMFAGMFVRRRQLERAPRPQGSVS